MELQHLQPQRRITILLVDDDVDERLLIRKAFERDRLLNTVVEVSNGQEMLDYLLRRGPYPNPKDAPRPGLILLDLNMPVKDGREALQEMRAHPELQGIPVIVFTVSESEADVMKSYDLGVSAYITKPPSLANFQQVLKGIEGFWIEIVRLPHRD